MSGHLGQCPLLLSRLYRLIRKYEGHGCNVRAYVARSFRFLDTKVLSFARYDPILCGGERRALGLLARHYNGVAFTAYRTESVTQIVPD